MSLFQILIISLVQGSTEFLPISSQAHLIVIPALLGWPDHGRFMDVAMHMGTLLAVLAYFYRDLYDLFLRGLFPLFKGKVTREGWLILYLMIATIPAVGVGYLIHHFLGDGMRGIYLIALSSIVFGSLFYGIDRWSPRFKTLEHMTARGAFVIGCFQLLAFIPGASRSGSTIMGARLLGFNRGDSARFSFLMSIPVVTGALVLEGGSAFKSYGLSFVTSDLLFGIFISFLAGFFSISFLLAYLRRYSYAPFMIYRVLLGGGLLVWMTHSV